MNGNAKVRENVKENIKKYREKIGLTQRQLADRIGIDPSTVAYWEIGRGAPNADTLVLLCDIFQVKPAVLMGVVDEFASKQTEAEAFMALYNAAPPEIRLAVDSLLRRKV